MTRVAFAAALLVLATVGLAVAGPLRRSVCTDAASCSNTVATVQVVAAPKPLAVESATVALERPKPLREIRPLRVAARVVKRLIRPGFLRGCG